MSNTPSADEKPKEATARKVVAEKRRYFVPDAGISVLAEDAHAAIKRAKTLKTSDPEKEGDA